MEKRALSLDNTIISIENRLIYYKGLETRGEAGPSGREVEKKNQDLISAIENNLAIDHVRYKRFEKGTTDRALLISILQKRRELHPENPAGLTEDNPNLSAIAERLGPAESAEADLKGAKQKLERGRLALFDKANSIYVERLKQPKEGALEAAVVTQINDLQTTVEGLKSAQTIDPSVVTQNKTVVQAQIELSLKTIQEKEGEIRKTRINPTSSITAKTEAGQKEYVQIPALKSYVDYLTAVYEYLDYLEVVEAEWADFENLAPVEKIKKYDEKKKKIDDQLNRFNGEIETTRQAGANDIDSQVKIEFLKKQVTSLQSQKQWLQEAYRSHAGGAAAYVENARSTIKEGRSNITQNVQIAMEEYLTVMDKLNNAEGKWPSDLETQRVILAAAMLSPKGLDAALNNPKITTDFQINPYKQTALNFSEFGDKKILAQLAKNKNELIEGENMKPMEARAFKALCLERAIFKEYDQFKGDIGNLTKSVQKIISGTVPEEGLPQGFDLDNEAFNLKLSDVMDQGKGTREVLSSQITEFENLKNLGVELVDDAKINSLKQALVDLDALLSNFPSKKLPPKAVLYYTDEEKAQMQEVLRILKSTQAALETNSLSKNREQMSLDRSKVALYQVLEKALGKPFIAANIESGDMALADKILQDVNSVFVPEYNKARRQEFETASNISKPGETDILGTVADASHENILEGLEGLAAIESAFGIKWQGAFRYYWEKGYWTDPNKNVNIWEKDLDSKLPGKGKESAAYQILDEILPYNVEKRQFLEDLINPNSAKHKESRKILGQFIDDFRKCTKFSEDAQEIRTAYNEKINEQGATVTDKVMGTVRHVMGGIFDSGQPIERRIMYGAIAYLFIFKGVLNKDSSIMSKITKYGGGALLAGMLYEDLTQKSILGIAGIESPFEKSRGSILNRMMVEVGIKNNDQAGYRAGEVLHRKTIQDVIKWYDNRYALDKTKKKGLAPTIAYQNSLVSSKLVTSAELDFIDPTQGDPEVNAKKFKDVIEKHFIFFGHKASRGEDLDEGTLIQRGRDFLFNHYTQEGIRKEDVPLLSKADLDEVTKGDHRYTFEEVSGAMTTATDIENAMAKSEGLPWLARAAFDSLEWVESGVMPAWFRIKDWSREKASQLRYDLANEYGPEGIAMIEQLGKEGYRFARDKKDELQVWWGTSQEAVRLRKTGANSWEILKTGAYVPWMATFHAAEWSSGTLKDLLLRFEGKEKQYLGNEVEILGDLFPIKAAPGITLTPDAIRLEKEGKTMLFVNKISNGYKIFGRFENDFIQINAARNLTEGILTRDDFLTNEDSRLKMNEEEGYINFVGHDPEGNPARAYQEGVSNLIRYLKKNIKVIDQSTPEGLALVEALDLDKEEPGLIRDKVERFIERFGAYKTQHNGYLVFLHFPFPTASNATEYTEKFIDTGARAVVDVRRKVKYKNRYIDLARNLPSAFPSRFEEYKHSLRFTSGDNLFELGYVEGRKTARGWVPAWDGYFIQKYMQEFGLFSKNQAKGLLDGALGIGEGIVITNYKENENIGEALFQEVVKNRDIIAAQYLPERNFLETKRMITRGFLAGNMAKQVGDEFTLYHNNLEDYFVTQSIANQLREWVPGHETLQLRYRRFILGKLSQKYRDNPKYRITPQELRNVTKDFIKENKGSLQEIGLRAWIGIQQTGKGLDWLSKKLDFADLEPERKIP